MGDLWEMKFVWMFVEPLERDEKFGLLLGTCGVERIGVG